MHAAQLILVSSVAEVNVAKQVLLFIIIDCFIPVFFLFGEYTDRFRGSFGDCGTAAAEKEMVPPGFCARSSYHTSATN